MVRFHLYLSAIRYPISSLKSEQRCSGSVTSTRSKNLCSPVFDAVLNPINDSVTRRASSRIMSSSFHLLSKAKISSLFFDETNKVHKHNMPKEYMSILCAIWSLKNRRWCSGANQGADFGKRTNSSPLASSAEHPKSANFAMSFPSWFLKIKIFSGLTSPWTMSCGNQSRPRSSRKILEMTYANHGG